MLWGVGVNACNTLSKTPHHLSKPQALAFSFYPRSSVLMEYIHFNNSLVSFFAFYVYEILNTSSLLPYYLHSLRIFTGKTELLISHYLRVEYKNKENPFISFLFYYWIFYLHFKCYLLSQFPNHKPPILFPTPSSMRVFPYPTTHSLPPPRPDILLHWGSSLGRTKGFSSH